MASAIKAKKVYLLLFSMLVIFGLFSNSVLAQLETPLPDIIEKFAKFLFLDMSKLADSADEAFVIYSKFIFFLLVFTIFYWGVSKAMPDNKRVGGTIAFLFALIASILIPKELMIFIFQTYSTIISMLAGLLPFIIGLIIAQTAFKGDEKWQRLIRAVIYIAMGVATFALVAAVESIEGGELYNELAQWAAVGGTIAMIGGLVALIGSIGGEGGPEGERKSPKWLRKHVGGPFGKLSDEEKDKEAEAEEGEAGIKLTAEQIEEIKDVHEKIKTLKTGKVDPLLNPAYIPRTPANWNMYIEGYNVSIDELQRKLDNLIALDEQVKKYVKRMERLAESRVRRDVGSREQRKVIRKLNRTYKTENYIEKMALDVKDRLDKTKFLPIILRAWAATLGGGPPTGFPAAPAGYPPRPVTYPHSIPAGGVGVPIAFGPGRFAAKNETHKLQDALDEIKDVNNLLVKLFRHERSTLSEIT